MHLRNRPGFFCYAAFGLLVSYTATAQISTWIPPGSSGPQDWNLAGNWDNAITPNSPLATAVFVATNGALDAPAAIPAGSTITLDGIQYQLPNTPATTPLQISYLQIDGVLRIVGAGISNHKVGQTAGSIVSNSNIFVTNGMLEFSNQASYAGSGGIMVGSDRDLAAAGTLRFLDNSSLTTRTVYAFGGSLVEFAGNSRVGNGVSFLLGDPFPGLGQVSLVFRDQASAGAARVYISTADSSVVVRDQADVAQLRIGNFLPFPARGGSVDISAAAGDVRLRSLDGNINVILGANSLRFDQLGAGEAMQLGGTISGSGGLAILSPGIITVTNPNNSYTGLTDLRQGVLQLAGGRISGTTIGSSAKLTGTGVIAGDLLNNGTLSAGSSTATGTLTVAGNFTQSQSGTLQIKILGATDHDRLAVLRRSDFQGTVAITAPTGYVPVGGVTEFVFMTSQEGILDNHFPRSLVITNPFSQYSALNVAINIRAGVVGNSDTSPGSYTLSVQQRSYTGFAGGPSARSLAAYLDANAISAAGELRKQYVRLNTMTSAAQIGLALDALTPDRYSVLAENGFIAAASQQAALDRRLAAQRDDASTSGLELFFEAGYRSADFDAVAGLPKADTTGSSGTASGLWHQEHFTLGAALTYETGNANLDAQGSTADFKSIVPQIFFQYAANRFFLAGSAAFSRDDYELRRRVVYSGFDRTASAAPAGGRTDLMLTAGYSFHAGECTFTPMAGVLASRWRMDDFTETGGDSASLAFSNWTAKSFRTRAGADIVYHSRDGKFTPALSVRWLHDFEDKREVAARFAAVAGGFTSAGRPGETDLVQANLSLDFRIARRASFYGSFGGAWGKDSSVSADLSGGLRWTF